MLVFSLFQDNTLLAVQVQVIFSSSSPVPVAHVPCSVRISRYYFPWTVKWDVPKF